MGEALEVEVLGAPDGEIRIEIDLKNPNTRVRSHLGVITGVSRDGRVLLQGPVLDIDHQWNDVLVRGFTGAGKKIGFDVNTVE